MSALLAELLPYVLVFYLADGLTQVRLRQWLFISAAGGHRRKGTGLYFFGLLPWTEVVAVDQDQVLLAPGGVGIFRDQGRYAPKVIAPEDVEWIPWSSLGELKVSGRWVYAAKQLLCVATSKNSAMEIAARIDEVKGVEAERRAEVIERLLEAATDLESFRRIRLKTLWLRRGLATVSTLIFTVVFLLLPLALYTSMQRHLPLEPLLLVVAGCAVAAAMLGGALIFRAGVRGGIAQEVIPFLLFPPNAARALASLSRGMYCKCDVAVLSLMLLPRETFLARAREEFNRIRLGRERALGTELDGWYLSRQRAWQRVARGAGLDLDRLLSPPTPSHVDSRSYCPLCSGEYRVGFDTCSECGVWLAPFEETR